MPPLCIAHRGGAALRPENTLAAFAHAMALGADGAELDVQLSRDGHVAVVHDFRLSRDLCRDRAGVWLAAPGPPIAQLTLDDIELFDVGRARPGSVHAQEHPDMVAADGERIPLLAEVVALARSAAKPFRLFIELKTSLTDPSLSAPPEMLAEAVVAILKQMDYLERSILVGFDWRGLLRAKTIAPSCVCWFSTRRHWARSGTSPWAAGFDASKFGSSVTKAIKAAGGDGWFPWWRDATADAIADAHAHELAVGAWTVNDPATMHVLIANGIDAICTDRPDLMTC